MASQFSKRTSWDTEEGPLARLARERRTAGAELLDLTVSNPTTCGFEYEQEVILSALRNPAALTYDPDPKGMFGARKAVVDYYYGHGADLGVDDVILTTSTSEAYSFLFRLLCNPGDSVLAAQPSYPLFDFLADLDDVKLRPYPLFQDFGWWIDFARLESSITPETRAIIVVHPNNPTGHSTDSAERQRLEALCVRYGLTLIVDEVFLDYGIGGAPQSFANGPHACLTFVVSGLSKICALPQMKVGWLACFGPESLRSEALARLEVIADTFLSMNAPAQLALPTWLGTRGGIQQQILARVRANLAVLADAEIDFIPVEAGWSAILRLPQHLASATIAEEILVEAGVVVHPGSFYSLPGAQYVVVSLICQARVFTSGVRAIKRWCESRALTKVSTR